MVRECGSATLTSCPCPGLRLSRASPLSPPQQVALWAPREPRRGPRSGSRRGPHPAQRSERAAARSSLAHPQHTSPRPRTPRRLQPMRGKGGGENCREASPKRPMRWQEMQEAVTWKGAARTSYAGAPLAPEPRSGTASVWKPACAAAVSAALNVLLRSGAQSGSR